MEDFDENSEESDIKIDQRQHERDLNELYNSGYRDAYQANMEDEKCMQHGFNAGYKAISKISFLIGTIYSYFERHKFRHDVDLHVIDHDLIKLKALLETIETKLVTNENYEKIIKNSNDLNENFENNLELNQIMSEFYNNLSLLKDYFKSTVIKNESSHVENINENLLKLIERMNNI
jgi:hypothetical protein